MSAGHDTDSKASGSVAMCWFLPRCPQYRQHEYPGSYSGLWSLWFHGQVGWLRWSHKLCALHWLSDLTYLLLQVSVKINNSIGLKNRFQFIWLCREKVQMCFLFIFLCKSFHSVSQIWSRFCLQCLGQKRSLLIQSSAVCMPLEPGSLGGGTGLRARCCRGKSRPGWIHAHIQSLLPGYHEEETGTCEERRGSWQWAHIRPSPAHAQHWYKDNLFYPTECNFLCFLMDSYLFFLVVTYFLSRRRFHKHFPSLESCPLAWRKWQWASCGGASCGPLLRAVCFYWAAKGG